MTSKSREHYFFELSLSPSALLRWSLLLCAAVLGGLAGFCAVIIAQILLKVGGDDAAEKHGISTFHSSRLGGVVVFSFIVLSYLWLHFVNGQIMINSNVTGILVASSAFFLLGLFEDLKGLLKANIRFIAMLVIMTMFLLLRPEFMLTKTSLILLDEYILAFSVAAFVFTMFGMVFLVNSFNTADGANGLVSGVSLVVCVALIQLGLGLTGGLLALVATGCAIFMLFNVVVGRIFFGDGGAYFLGSVIGLTMISVLNDGLASPWYLLCLVFYPHADLLFSMLRRKGAGKSLFGADNGHLHNLIYRKLSSIPSMKPYANTTTGLAIAATFALVPLLIWNYVAAVNWMWVYAGLWFLYAAAWGLFSDHNIRDIMIK